MHHIRGITRSRALGNAHLYKLPDLTPSFLRSHYLLRNSWVSTYGKF